MFLTAVLVLRASLSFRKKFNIIMTTISVDLRAVQRASISGAG